MVLYGDVYDVTEFLPHHPGGAQLILPVAGRDATMIYELVHPPNILEENLRPEAKIGRVIDHNDGPAATVPKMPAGKEGSEKRANEGTKDEAGGNTGSVNKDENALTIRNSKEDDHTGDEITGSTPLESLLNIDDVEKAATKRLSYRAWAYYYSAADDLVSKSLNNQVYRSITMRPRVFVDATRCDLSTILLDGDISVNMPVFVCPAAMAKLAHPDGEHGIARACGKFGAMQIMSNNASQTPEQIVEGAIPNQVFGWQLYILKLREKSETMLAKVAKIPNIKFICLTLDVPAHGKREHDERIRSGMNTLQVTSALHEEGGALKTSQEKTKSTQSYGIGKSLFQGTATDMTWATTLPWLLKHTKLPLVLKGIQTYEDAYLASLCAPQVKAIILSNHGGRALDTAPSALHTLLEIRKHCPEVFQKIDVWVDGGIKRGTDVVKALCLGAKAVGIGRAALYGLGAGGVPGVERVLESEFSLLESEIIHIYNYADTICAAPVLRSEIETCMRLLGVQRVDQLGMQHVRTYRDDLDHS